MALPAIAIRRTVTRIRIALFTTLRQWPWGRDLITRFGPIAGWG